MWHLWLFIDKLITLPAFICGYLCKAYAVAFRYGKTKYMDNLRKSVGAE